MRFKLISQPKSIRHRWMFSNMSALTLIVMLALASFCIAMAAYYYTTMGNGLNTRASQAASLFRNYTEEEYYQWAQSYVSSFSEQNILELQFLSPDGQVRLSSYGLTANTTPDTNDIRVAVETMASYVWSGRDPHTGEHIMAASAPVVYNGSVVGVVRVVTSLVQADRQIILMSGLGILVGLLILGLCYLSNLLFLRSIVAPVSRLTEAAKRIAEGGYGIQIPKQYEDEIGELTDSINDMSLKIKQSEKVQSEFISSVSHELRTPLTAINGWAETIASGELTDPKDVKKGMDIIVSEARRLTNMVEELLEFSRIEDGRFTLSVEPIDIKAELEDAVYTYKEFFRKEGIILTHTDCEEDFPPISGDPERLRQVFCNLLDNAAKHGGAGKKIDTSICREGNDVVIRIRDYGPGIPEEELPFIKQKFYKGSSKARGSGIGLAVCEEIITRHNGVLEIGNAEGGGCVVTIRLPTGT